LADGRNDGIRVVACVRNKSLPSRVSDQVFRFRDVVLLARREDDVKGLAFRRRDRVDLGGKTSSRTAQMIASDPPFPPAASWCARTTVPSTSEPTSSSMHNSLKTRSHTPRRAQRAKRLYVVCQGPYRSGMSRQGAPVLSRHRTALTNARSPNCDRGPGCTGRRSLTFPHCSSVSSCRCTRIVPHGLNGRATFSPELIEDTP
jgi:hypothetical protein